MKNLVEKIEWVKTYMTEVDSEVDVLNQKFVEAYVKAFNARVTVTNYGADKCPELGKVLSEGHRLGVFIRNRIGLSGMIEGFPRWVYVYEISESQ